MAPTIPETGRPTRPNSPTRPPHGVRRAGRRITFTGTGVRGWNAAQAQAARLNRARRDRDARIVRHLGVTR